MTYHLQPTTYNRGFTLIELIVSIGLFAIVMLMVTGGYLQMIALTRQAQAQATAADNLGFALDTMARTIRTGHAYSCGQAGGDCASSPENSFSFVDVNGIRLKYELGSQLDCGLGSTGGCLLEHNYTANTTNVLTDPSINLTSLSFYLSGSSPSDQLQPFLTISMSGQVPAGAGKTVPITLETAAAMRGIDLGP